MASCGEYSKILRSEDPVAHLDYAKKLFEKHITVKIGKPIPYTLEEDEIMREWAGQICEFTGYENRIEESIANPALV